MPYSSDESLPSDFVLSNTERALNPQNIGSGQCFMCGDKPTNGSGEHVVPKWLQRRFNLWDERIGLLNGSVLPYRSLRVPACVNCNTNVLGEIETYISNLSAQNIPTWSISDSYDVGRWMAKILIGIIYKEARLLYKQSNPSLGMIFPPEKMGELFLLHLLVQSLRKKVHFSTIHTHHPFTLYVYSLSVDKNFGAFNLSTNIFGKSICMRFGDLGFAFVGDGGLQHEMADLGPFNLARQQLHPVQFDELAARVHYKSALRDASHSYIHWEDEGTLNFQQINVIPYTKIKLPDGSDQVFRPWSQKELAKVFEMYKVSEFEYLINEVGEAAYTRLVDKNGRKISF